MMTIDNDFLWDKLKNTDKKIVLYGTGNGADKIIDILNSEKITISGIFASDGFVRDRSFRGYKVESYNSIIDRYGNDIIILPSFGSSLPEVMDRIYSLDDKHEVLMPDVPLYGGELFTYDHYKNSLNDIEYIYNILRDDKSKELYNDIINFRLTGKLSYTRNTESLSISISNLCKGDYDSILDGGAFNGDTSLMLNDIFHPSRLYALEPDSRSFRKLSEKTSVFENIKPINAALSDEDIVSVIKETGSRGTSEYGSNRRAKDAKINFISADNITERLDLIKLDIEGNEEKAISGSERIIKEYQPDLIISAYHKTDDIITLIKYIESIKKGYSYYLRRVPCLPLWDINIFAIKKD